MRFSSWGLIALLAAALGTEAALAAPYPAHGTAVVDGAIDEWQLSGDYFGDMCHFWAGSQVLLSRLYLRYDCDSRTVYVLSLQVSDDHPVLVEDDEAWAKIDGAAVVTDKSGNNGVPPDFAWVGLNYAGPDTARGWEGSFTLAPGAYHFAAHQNMFYDEESQTVRTRNGDLDLMIYCQPVDFGDAPTATQSGRPSSYPTLMADAAACHVIVPGFSLGGILDAEPDGQPSDGAVDDDEFYFPWDEDGVLFISMIAPSRSVAVRVTLLNSAGRANPRLDAWIDFNHDGDWDDEGERIFAGQPLSPGRNNLSFLTPGSMPTGKTYARFRLSDGGVTSPRGLAESGEVEDWVVRTYADDQKTYSVGNRFFIDDGRDGGTPEDGIQNGGEPGFADVKLELRDGQDVAGTYTTSANGYYRFDHMPAGAYTVFVPEQNFMPGAPLYRWLSSPGCKAGNGEDHGIDSSRPWETGITSMPFALEDPMPFGEEPAFDGMRGNVRLMSPGENPPEGHFDGGDENDDLGIDFGFYPSSPTGAHVKDFQALMFDSGAAMLQWSTLVESAVLGFHVDRLGCDGRALRITSGVVPAIGTAWMPGSYSIDDPNALASGAVSYRLVAVDLRGQERVVAETQLWVRPTVECSRNEECLTIRFRGRPATVLTIETATDSVEGPWTRVESLELDSTGTGAFSLRPDDREPMRFYRAHTK